MADPRKKFRQMVSLSKRRFQDKDFDLDLTCNNYFSNIFFISTYQKKTNLFI